MDDDERYFLEPDSTYTLLVHGSDLKVILMKDDEKIKTIKTENGELGEEFAKFDMRTLPTGTIINNNHKSINLNLAAFRSFLPE